MDKELTLVEHLSELRTRIIICLVVFVIIAIASFPFTSLLLKILKLPAQGSIEKLAFFGPADGFLIYMRLAILCGLILAMPVIMYQLWSFVSPAMDEKIRKYTGLFTFSCSFLFICGCLFAYFALLPPALQFLLSFGRQELVAVISANTYISFVITLILGCGFVFQMPVVSVILTRVGVLKHQLLRKNYKYAFIIILIAAAALTPTPDIFNMLLMAVPMLLLYEVSIWASWLCRVKAPVCRIGTPQSRA